MTSTRASISGRVGRTFLIDPRRGRDQTQVGAVAEDGKSRRERPGLAGRCDRRCSLSGIPPRGRSPARGTSGRLTERPLPPRAHSAAHSESRGLPPLASRQAAQNSSAGSVPRMPLEVGACAATLSGRRTQQVVRGSSDEPADQDRVHSRLRGAKRDGDDDGRSLEAPQKVAQPFQRGGVTPVQVVDGDQEWLVDRRGWPRARRGRAGGTALHLGRAVRVTHRVPLEERQRERGGSVEDLSRSSGELV